MDDFIRRPDRPNTETPVRRPIEPVTRPVVDSPGRKPASTAIETTKTGEASVSPRHEDPVAKLPPRARAPVAAIVVAILISVGLIGLTIFAYNRQQKDDAPATNATEQTSTPDTTQTIEDSSDSIDETLNGLDDSTDFNESDLSDQTLNL